VHKLYMTEKTIFFVTCSFHEKEERKFCNFTPWTMRKEKHTIFFINHCIWTMRLHLKMMKKIQTEACLETVSHKYVHKSNTTKRQILKLHYISTFWNLDHIDLYHVTCNNNYNRITQYNCPYPEWNNKKLG